MNKHYVYVYGSLRPGNGDKYHIPGKLYTLGGFPAAILQDPEEGEEFSTFVAEKVAVTDKQLEALDHYEGYDKTDERTSFYLRVKYRDGWIYEFNSPLSDDKVIAGGDWLEFKGQKQGHSFDFFLGEAEVVTTEVPSAEAVKAEECACGH